MPIDRHAAEDAREHPLSRVRRAAPLRGSGRAGDQALPTGRRGKGTCTNERTISRGAVEGRILPVLKERLLTPDLVAEFTRAFQEETNRIAAESRASVDGARAALTGVQRKIDAMLRAIEDGLYQPSMKARLAELEAETARLTEQLRQQPTPAVLVHPNLADLYAKRVAALESRLDDAEHRDEAMELIRSMVETIVVAPNEEGGVALTLHGDLARILTLCATAGEGTTMRTARSPSAHALGLEVSLVAGAGFEPATFRL
ncbi:hypothetical protein ACTZWW_21500 [Salinarimonas sp. NSM]|uniref:hypothetical protein n=1 Tax=Salinarimonas sp. NSM TaxID=3458003 RepID=UPI0040350847